MNCGATAAFSTLRRSGSPWRLQPWIAAFGDGLIRHECLALIMSRWLRRWGRVGCGSLFGRLWLGLWLRRWPRRRVVLRRRRDDDQRRRKILGVRRKRRGKGDERKRGGTSNGVRLHGRDSCPRFARGVARPTTCEPAEEIPSGAAPTHSPNRVARCASERRFASLDRT